MKQRLSAALTAIVLASLASAQLAVARDEEKVVLNIASQPIGDALNDLARQTGLQVVLYSKLGDGVRSPAVVGSYSAAAALKLLLANSNLRYEFLDRRTVAIQGPKSAAAQLDRASPGASRLRLGQTDGADAQPESGRQLSAQPATQDASASGLNRLTLEEVIVTAQKRRENVLEVPIAISVITGEHLEQYHATQLVDFANYVPGMQVNYIGRPGFGSVTLRGITSNAPNQTVGVYIDEAPVGSSSVFAAEASMTTDLLPYDIERIEVLRGPQGTLYGASGNAGLLKYVTRAPNLSDFELRVGAEVSDLKSAGDPGSGARLGLNAPLIEDKLALRASYGYLLTPGYVDNIALGIEDQNEAVQEAGRVTLLWRVSDAVSLKVAGMWQSIDSDNNGFSLLDNPARTPVADGFALDNLVPEPFERDMGYYAATLDWSLGRVEFVSATSYSKAKSTFTFDTGTAFTGVPGVALTPLTSGLDLEKWTQEFRLVSPSDARLEWLLGAFYTREDNFTNQVVNFLTPQGAPVVGIDPLITFDEPTRYREYALFGNFTYKFTERFDVTAGLRWARNDQDFKGVTAAGGEVIQTLGDSSESVVTYSLAPRLRLNPGALLYARIASGYRPGGPNSPTPGARPQADSDLLTTYEIGVKAELLARRLVFDAAVFRMDWDDIQVLVNAAPPNDEFSFVDNGGKAWSQGAELAATLKPTQSLRLGVNVAYTDTELTQLSPNANAEVFRGRPGDELPQVPQWTASATANYEFPIGAWRGRIGAGYRFVDQRLSDFESSALTLRIDSYDALDLNAELSTERWTARVFAANVTDEPGQFTVGQSNTPQYLAVSLLRPRTVGLSVDVRF